MGRGARLARTAAAAAAVLGVPFFVVWHEQLWWWIEVHTGTVNEAGPYYGFWSGFGSDLGEYMIIVGLFHGIYLHWKSVNCHEPGCPRVGRYQAAGGQYRLCHHHHPDLMGARPDRELIHLHHRQHKAATSSERGAR